MHALLQLGQGLVTYPGQAGRDRAPLHALCTDVLSFRGAQALAHWLLPCAARVLVQLQADASFKLHYVQLHCHLMVGLLCTTPARCLQTGSTMRLAACLQLWQHEHLQGASHDSDLS